MMGLVDQGLDIDERVMNAFMIESCCSAAVLLWCESNWELGVAHIIVPRHYRSTSNTSNT